MRKTILTLLMLCALGHVSAQVGKCAIDTKALVAEQVAEGATTISFLVKMQPGYDRARLEKSGIKIGAEAGQIVTLRVPVEQLGVLEENREVMQYSISHRIASPMMDKTRQDTRTDQVHSGEGIDGGVGYTGKGVYIGITDWGFDYNHPNLRDEDGKTRVVRAWDHFRSAGAPPSGFDYGVEIVGSDAVADAKGDTSNLYGYGTHGTHVAGIAAGSGAGTPYTGQAPEANLLLCSFGLGEAEWIDGVAWMQRVAREDGKRLVVNSSWGMYSFSTLDGTSLLCQAMNAMMDSGVVFCTSAGNNGGGKFHISRTFDGSTPDTLKTVATYYTYASDAIGQCLIIWGEAGHDFEACFRMQKNGEVWSSPMLNTATGDTVIYDSLQCGNKKVGYRILMERVNPFDARPHIQMDVDRVSGLQLQLFVTAQDGTVHAWNVANKTNHAGNEGADFNRGNNAGFSIGNDNYAIGEPGCSLRGISVAAHMADEGNVQGSITSFSSPGPLIDGTIKPDISAPGYQVVSSISSYEDAGHEAVDKVVEGNHTYIWAPLSGTSMSSPATTGVVALMLQANPNITPDRVREILTETARNDNRTGAIHSNGEPSKIWGWGKVDAQQAVNKVLRTVGIQQAEEQRLPISVAPNPATGRVTLRSGCGEEQAYAIYTIDGREVHRGSIVVETQIDTHEMSAGVYIVRIGSRTAKLVVE